MGHNAFDCCSSLSTVEILGNVTKICESTFSGCSSLSSIVFPPSVALICENAFGGCSSLKSITIPPNVTRIDSFAFWNCSSLSLIILPANVTRIGNSAFCHCCSLKSITIPPRVELIDIDAFHGCSLLKLLAVLSKKARIKSHAFYHCEALNSVLLPESIRSIYSDIFERCSDSLHNALHNFAILLDESEKCVIGVCKGYNGIIEIPEGIERIGKNAFFRSKVSGVKLPKSLRFIDESAFANCSELKTVDIGFQIESIGLNAFIGCMKLDVKTINEIGFSSFRSCFRTRLFSENHCYS